MQKTLVQFLEREDPLEKGKATHSSISGLENSTDCTAHGVAMSLTQLSDFHSLSPWKFDSYHNFNHCPATADP